MNKNENLEDLYSPVIIKSNKSNKSNLSRHKSLNAINEIINNYMNNTEFQDTLTPQDPNLKDINNIVENPIYNTKYNNNIDKNIYNNIDKNIYNNIDKKYLETLPPNSSLNKKIPQSDLTRLWNFLKFHCIKILLACILIFFIYHLVICIGNQWGYFLTEEQKRINFYKQEIKTFKGWKTEEDKIKDKTNNKNIKQGKMYQENLHFIVYGKTGSGKTTFIKKYINQYYKDETKVHIFCMHTSEWPTFTNVYNDKQLDELQDMESFAGTPENKSLLILDDVASLSKQKNMSEIFTKGRHQNIQIVVLAHKACDVDNKIRENIQTFFTTTQNNAAFFNDINKNYKMNMPLSYYTHHKYGIIRVDTISEHMQVYDKDLNILVDTEHEIYNNSQDFDIRIYANTKHLSNQVIEQIIIFLESEAKVPLKIIPDTFYFYFDHYLNAKFGIPIPKRLQDNETLNYLKIAINDVRNALRKATPIISDVKSTFSDAKSTFVEAKKTFNDIKPLINGVSEILNN